MDHQVHINVDTEKVYGTTREVTGNEVRIVCDVIKKLGNSNKLEDIGLAALNGLRDSNTITVTAAMVLDAKEQCQAIRKREAQQQRNTKAELTRQRLDPRNDPHERNL